MTSDLNASDTRLHKTSALRDALRRVVIAHFCAYLGLLGFILRRTIKESRIRCYGFIYIPLFMQVITLTILEDVFYDHVCVTAALKFLFVAGDMIFPFMFHYFTFEYYIREYTPQWKH